MITYRKEKVYKFIFTEVILTNEQIFDKFPRNKNLIVDYGHTTMSIPAQTTPYKSIVLCGQNLV
ncbi:hypothetical protein [Clostridium saccharoperbutylacetonicum]